MQERLDIPRFLWRGADRSQAMAHERPREINRGQPYSPVIRPDPRLGAKSEPRAEIRTEPSWQPVPRRAAHSSPMESGPPRVRRRRPLGIWVAGVSLVLAAGVFLGASRAGLFSSTAPLSAHIDELMIMAGLGVDEIHVTGHRYTLDDDIFAALELNRPTSLLRYSPEAARRRVEALSWVSRATVTRVLPNTVAVRISERVPIAIWLNGETASLVDVEGRELARVAQSTLPALPRISGQGAPSAAGALIEALKAHPSLGGRVTLAERVGQRRWSLELDNGSRVHLPAEDEMDALRRLADVDARAGLLREPNRVVDLRVAGRIAVAPREAMRTSAALPVQSGVAVRQKSASAL